MRRTALTALALSLLFATSLRAQDWSAEHREVWETVRTYWGMFTGGDIDGFAEYFHEDFTGWTYNAPEPRGKTDVVTSARRYAADGSFTEFNLKPAAIKVFGDVAVAHYFFEYTYVDSEGVTHEESGRWTDVLMKHGDKWVTITDHGGSQ